MTTDEGYEIEPGPADDAGSAPTPRRPLTDPTDQPDVCPNCGAGMPDPEALVCMRCGFDQKQNRIIKTKVGVDEVADPAQAQFVRPGRLGFRAPLIAGAVLAVSAATLSGVHADARPVLHAVATLLFAPVYAGIGVAAVMLTAALMEDRFGRLELAAARMLLAVGLADAAWHAGQTMELHAALRFLIGAGAGAGLYFLAVWWLFRLNRAVAALVGVTHLSLWLIFRGLLALEALLASPAPAP
ncbi:MAG: hypothetical protein D6693_04705 [Planctomycetota bacterium]|nr:MAG: hypothetical protein D6693_04705 [Planctomycetota bacterium]